MQFSSPIQQFNSAALCGTQVPFHSLVAACKQVLARHVLYFAFLCSDAGSTG